MKTSFVLTLLSAAVAVLAAPNHYARQEATPTPTTISTVTTPAATPSATSTTSGELPCPTNPPNCASKLDGHLVCMAGGVWCRYTDPSAHWTPGFYPVNYQGPCPACLPAF